MSAVIESVTTFADGFGRWRARIDFVHTLSESDPRTEFNLNHHWKALRTRARRAIITELVEREQKSGESRLNAEHRIRTSLPNLVVVEQYLDSMNCWHGITLGEP